MYCSGTRCCANTIPLVTWIQYQIMLTVFQILCFLIMKQATCAFWSTLLVPREMFHFEKQFLILTAAAKTAVRNWSDRNVSVSETISHENICDYCTVRYRFCYYCFVYYICIAAFTNIILIRCKQIQRFWIFLTAMPLTKIITSCSSFTKCIRVFLHS